MSAVDMIALAVAASTCSDARQVLVDHLHESGWWDDRIHFALSNGDDRDEFLALLEWPGETGESCARLIVEALATKAGGAK